MTYPQPICMECGQECYIFEEVDVGYGGPIELWNYCQNCDVETFHEIPVEPVKEET